MTSPLIEAMAYENSLAVFSQSIAMGNSDGKPPGSSDARSNGFRGRIVSEMEVWGYDIGVIGTSCEVRDLDLALRIPHIAGKTHFVGPGNLLDRP